MNELLDSPHPTLSLWRGLLLPLTNFVASFDFFKVLLPSPSFPLLLDDCIDAGGWAMSGTIAERVRVRRFKNRKIECDNDKLEPNFVPCALCLSP
jgi:hypothetical protein